MRDAKGQNPPDLFSQIISRANRSISSFHEEFQYRSSRETEEKMLISEKKCEMLNVIESSTQNTDNQLKEIIKVRDWIDSLDRDRELFSQINSGSYLKTDSSCAFIENFMQEEKMNRKNQSKSKKYSKENALFKEKENLRNVSYTKSVMTMSKNLLLMQKEIQEAMKPEKILKNESLAASRLENLKKMLEIGLKNRKVTKKLLKKDLKDANKLFNNNAKYHKKLEEDLNKLEKFLLIFQSKSSIEIIEKAKKNNFIETQWKDKQKELKSQIREINIEISKYENKDQTFSELSNIIYGNNLELEKLKKSYDDIIESINQDMKLSNYYQTSSLQILEKELINSLNYHRGIESKNTQTDIKIATTSFTRLFMKFSKEKQSCFNKLDKVLRKSNVSIESAMNGLNEFKEENKNVLIHSMNQIINELHQVIENYGNVFNDEFEYNDRKLKLDAKNQIDVLIGRKQRLSSQIINREMDIAFISSSFETIEGVYFDILQTFLPNEMNFDEVKYKDIKNEIQGISSFINKASSIVTELAKKLQLDLNNQKQKNKYLKRSSSTIALSPKINLNKKQEEAFKCQKVVQQSIDLNKKQQEETFKSQKVVQQSIDLNKKQEETFKSQKVVQQSIDLNKKQQEETLKSQKVVQQSIDLNKKQEETFKSQKVVQQSITIEDDSFEISNESDEESQIKPLPPSKTKEKSPRFSSQNQPKNEEILQTNKPSEFYEKETEKVEFDQKIRCSLSSVPPEFVFMKKKKKQCKIKNSIKDNSPHFSERKSRKKQREKSRAEIEEARRDSILNSRQKSKRTMQDIPKIPFIKNIDPKIMNEIDFAYSFSGNSQKKNKIFKKEFKQKSKNTNEIENNRKSLNDEFYCIRNNINVTKKNISDLPFSKRKVAKKQVESKLYPFIIQNNSFDNIAFFKNYSQKSIKKNATVKVLSNVFDFSENILEKKINHNEHFQKNIFIHDQNKKLKSIG